MVYSISCADVEAFYLVHDPGNCLAKFDKNRRCGALPPRSGRLSDRSYLPECPSSHLVDANPPSVPPFNLEA